jgi:hypothetical protein
LSLAACDQLGAYRIVAPPGAGGWANLRLLLRWRS